LIKAGDYRSLGVKYPNTVTVASLKSHMNNPLDLYQDETPEQVATRLALNLREDFIRDASSLRASSRSK